MMGARQAAETREAMRLFKDGMSPRKAAKQAGIEYTTLVRALQHTLKRRREPKPKGKPK